MQTIRPNVMARRLKLAEELSKKNGGKLPNPWKLIQQGHVGLYRYIHRHPKEFKHFEVENAVGKEKTKNKITNFNIAIREEHLSTVTLLASKNNGVIPELKWLMLHGYTRLASYMKIYPKVFTCFQTEPESGLTYKKDRK